jgi:hypothetical protein
MGHATDQSGTTEAQRVAALQQQAKADYAAAQSATQQAAARNQLAMARCHAQVAAGGRK